MHDKKIIVAFLLFFFFTGCHQANEKHTAEPSQKTDSSSGAIHEIESRESFFYRQTMDIHNDVMAKMGKLVGYKKMVQQQSDSINQILATTDFPRQMAQRISRQLDTLQVLGKKLGAADSAMNAWMGQFNPDPKLASSDANADYFEKQKKSAETMKKQFFEALAAAEKFLK